MLTSGGLLSRQMTTDRRGSGQRTGLYSKELPGDLNQRDFALRHAYERSGRNWRAPNSDNSPAPPAAEATEERLALNGDLRRNRCSSLVHWSASSGHLVRCD